MPQTLSMQQLKDQLTQNINALDLAKINAKDQKSLQQLNVLIEESLKICYGIYSGTRYPADQQAITQYEAEVVRLCAITPVYNPRLARQAISIIIEHTDTIYLYTTEPEFFTSLRALLNIYHSGLYDFDHDIRQAAMDYLILHKEYLTNLLINDLKTADPTNPEEAKTALKLIILGLTKNNPLGSIFYSQRNLVVSPCPTQGELLKLTSAFFNFRLEEGSIDSQRNHLIETALTELSVLDKQFKDNFKALLKDLAKNLSEINESINSPLAITQEELKSYEKKVSIRGISTTLAPDETRELLEISYENYLFHLKRIPPQSIAYMNQLESTQQKLIALCLTLTGQERIELTQKLLKGITEYHEKMPHCGDTLHYQTVSFLLVTYFDSQLSVAIQSMAKKLLARLKNKTSEFLILSLREEEDSRLIFLRFIFAAFFEKTKMGAIFYEKRGFLKPVIHAKDDSMVNFLIRELVRWLNELLPTNPELKTLVIQAINEVEKDVGKKQLLEFIKTINASYLTKEYDEFKSILLSSVEPAHSTHRLTTP